MKKLFLVAILFSITSCATIFSGTSQVINVKAVNSKNNEAINGAVCSISDSNGVVYALQSNPGSVSVKRGQGALNPICKKDKFKQVSYAVGDSFNAVTIVNILFWPGFIVDAVTGSMNKYPSHIVVMMEPTK